MRSFLLPLSFVYSFVVVFSLLCNVIIGAFNYITFSGGGGNLIGLTYGDVPFFRGTFFPKNAESWVSVIKLCAEL